MREDNFSGIGGFNKNHWSNFFWVEQSDSVCLFFFFFFLSSFVVVKKEGNCKKAA